MHSKKSHILYDCVYSNACQAVNNSSCIIFPSNTTSQDKKMDRLCSLKRSIHISNISKYYHGLVPPITLEVWSAIFFLLYIVDVVRVVVSEICLLIMIITNEIASRHYLSLIVYS